MRNERWEQAGAVAADPFRRPEGKVGRIDAWCQETPYSFLISMCLTFLLTLLLALAGAWAAGQKAPIGKPSISVQDVVLASSVGDLVDSPFDSPSNAVTFGMAEPTSAPRAIEAPVVIDDLGDLPTADVTTAVDREATARQGKEIADAIGEITISGPPPEAGGAPLSGFFKQLIKDRDSTVFVIDKSGSMAGSPLARVQAELAHGIDSLQENQKFSVIFFDDVAWPMFAEEGRSALSATRDIRLVPATKENKRKANEWIYRMSGNGGTSPGGAMLMAIRAHPELIVLLSDGEFSPIYVSEIERANRGRSIIDCVGLSETIQTLQLVAKANKGKYYQAK